MMNHAYKHAQLMEESELRVAMSAYACSHADLLARRLLHSPQLYVRWQAEHSRLMRTVSDQALLPHQVAALRATACALVHRRAVFEYLRDARLTRSKRRRLFGLFYGCREYTNAVLAEHSSYVCCSSSYLCTHHLGEHLVHDAAFEEPLQLYEEFYGEYFRAFCDTELAETDAEKEAVKVLEALRPMLKVRVGEARQAILAMPRAPEKEWRELQIRKSNGDTQRLRTIFGNN
jgi:hypothetical protein